MAYSTEDTIAIQKARIRQQKQERYDTAVKALKDVKKVMGPTVPDCCGCACEWEEALETVNKALKEIGESE